MSKKKKRKPGPSKAPGAAELPREANAAADELAADTPTRVGAIEDDAVAELAHSVPTRAGQALEDAEDAAAELADEDGARTNVRKIQALGATEDERESSPSADLGFDFGGDPAGTAVGLDEPPDPGSAEAASPRLQSIVESLLFAADRPLGLRQLADLVEEPELERIRAAVRGIEQSWGERGVQLHEVAGGYQFRTHPANASWVQRLLQQKPIRLSRALLETLAIVSYRQPITRPEIDDIRGVDSGGTLKTLMDRALVRILGKKEEPGRPLLYGTTKEFLEFFSLRDLKDLPTLREYHELSEEHRAQVAALEGKAPAGTFVAEGEPDPYLEGGAEGVDPVDTLPKLARLEIAAPREDAAELAEIDRLIRTAGVATDSDLPNPEAIVETDEAVVTGRYEVKSRPVGSGGESHEDRDFDDDRARTSTFGDPLPDPVVPPRAGDFEEEESTGIRPAGLDVSLVDGRDPEKEPNP